MTKNLNPIFFTLALYASLSTVHWGFTLYWRTM